MKTLLATASVLALAACSSPSPVTASPLEVRAPVQQEGYRGIEKATLLAKGME